MTQKDFFLLIDELLENDPGTIKGTEVLMQQLKWDSLAVIGFIAVLDQHFSVSVAAVRILECKTASDLANLVADKLSL
jgi:acyl carrier protein